MTELCVFDLDGTLVNSLADLASSTNFALTKNGFAAYPTERYRYFVGDGVPMLICRALAQNDSPGARQAVQRDFSAYYEAHYADKTAPYEGCTQLLAQLSQRGVRCAVLSNKPDAFVKKIVGRLLAEADFAWVQGKKDGFPKKPDPTALLFILRTLGADPAHTLYIGDSDVDIRTGKAAGVATCGALWGFRTRGELKAAGADRLAETPLDILSLL